MVSSVTRLQLEVLHVGRVGDSVLGEVHLGDQLLQGLVQGLEQEAGVEEVHDEAGLLV